MHTEIMKVLMGKGYQAYVVGGAVRDRVLGVEPKDYDITTSATPDEILALFPNAKVVSAIFHDVVYVGDVEVATMREDGPYTDSRRPDYTVPTTDINKDLARRDFTCNAMAVGLNGTDIIDPFGGVDDLENGVLRAVGDPTDRIVEHPVRLLRAVRFAAKYGLAIDPYLAAAMENEEGLLRLVPAETMRDELLKGLDLDRADRYLALLHEFGFLHTMLPEVSDLIGVEQNKYHNGLDVFEHTVEAVMRAPKGLVRLAALLHDVGKPSVAEFVAHDYGYSFINHECTGSEIADDVCRRLRLTNEHRHLVVTAVRMHMSRIEGPKSARRFLRNCGSGMAAEFVMDVMEADKANRHPVPVTARQLVEAEITANSATKVTDLAISGMDVMNSLDIGPSPEVGRILNELLDSVLDDPDRNTREELLRQLSDL